MIDDAPVSDSFKHFEGKKFDQTEPDNTGGRVRSGIHERQNRLSAHPATQDPVKSRGGSSPLNMRRIKAKKWGKPEHAPTLSPLCPVSTCPRQPRIPKIDCDSMLIQKHLLDRVSRDWIAIPVDCPLRHDDDVQSL